MNAIVGKLVAIAALLLLAALAGCGSGEGDSAPEPRPVQVRTEVVSVAPVPDYYEVSGSVAAKVSTVLASQIAGQVTAVHVREGDRIRAGQLLVEIDSRDAAAQASRSRAGRAEAERLLDEVDRAIASAEQALVAAQAQAELARVTHDRYARLLERNSISRQEYDEAEARHRVAVAQAASANASLEAMRARRKAVEARIEQAGADVQAAAVLESYPRVTAPFAGVVTRKMVEVGAMATPGLPMLVLEDERLYRLEASVDETVAPRLAVGDAVPVVLTSLDGLRVEGQLSEIAPAADPASRSVTVKIDLPVVPGIRSGMFGRAEFVRGERQAVSLPRSALVERGQLVGVYVVDASGVAHLRMVTTGKQIGERVEVLSGLSAGERVVVESASAVVAGGRVVEAGQ
jgi:multidrug efflux pump subunit AcrA (membrane-fusion protein)